MKLIPSCLWVAAFFSIFSCAHPAKKGAPQAAPAVAAQAEAPKAAVEAAPVAGTVVCKEGTEERSLAIAAKGAGCELNYTKSGTTKSVATGNNGNTHCESVREKIMKKLTASGYACQ